jgi:hypothetical protein
MISDKITHFDNSDNVITSDNSGNEVSKFQCSQIQKGLFKIGSETYSMVKNGMNGILMSNNRLINPRIFTHGYKTRTTTNSYTHIVPIIAEHGKEKNWRQIQLQK